MCYLIPKSAFQYWKYIPICVLVNTISTVCSLAFIYHSYHSHLYNFCPAWLIIVRKKIDFSFRIVEKVLLKLNSGNTCWEKIFFMFVSPVILIELCSQMRMGLWVATEVWPPPIWDNEKQSQWNAQLLVKCAINWWFSSSTVITRLSSR